MAFEPYDPGKPVHRHQGNLPHWRQWGKTYFVTARLRDSLPATVRDEWLYQRRLWLSQNSISPDAGPDSLPDTLRAEFHRKFTARFHGLLDAGHGSCILSRPDCAAILADHLVSGHGKSYHLDRWVIMPNHFHALVEPLGTTTLGSILKQWKGASANQLNRHLGTSGSIWQPETFDHIVRSEERFEHFRQYILTNPEKAGLVTGHLSGQGQIVG